MARSRARSASFTAAESLKTLARSGSKRMRFVPCLKLSKYFPRTPLEKSYSARMPRGFDRLTCFILLALMLARLTRADEPDMVSPFDVTHDEEAMA